jgi:hypothetical protein
METINISQFEDSFVIHFGVDSNRINAYTLASTLINLADAAKVANNEINPGYEIEIVVEAIGSGSFKAKIKTFYKETGNLFSLNSLKQIVLNLIASYIFIHIIQPNSNVNITINSNEVIIQQSEKEYVISRSVYDSVKEIQKNPRFTNSISRAIRSVEKDPQIKNIGFSKNINDMIPSIEIQRERFSLLTNPLIDDEKESRIIEEIVDVEITKAILERSNRKWEFVWNGNKLSAPVLDQKFYDDFFAHKVTIAPGDILKVRLRMHQNKMPDIGVYINDHFEVEEVFEHIPKQKPQRLDLSN